MDANTKKRKGDNGEDYSLPDSFFNKLNTLSVDTLKTKDNRIFICKRDDKLVDVWKGLIKHNFHSVPVLLKTSDKYYGILSLHDISRYVLDFVGKEQLQSMEDFWKNLDRIDKLKNVTVNDCMQSPLTRENPFKPVTQGYSLHFALEILARESGLHRIPVITRDRKMANMLTTSRIVQFFHENKSMLGNRVAKPIHLLSSSSSGVISVRDTQNAVDAFALMQTNNITAVAVTDSHGKLAGVISDTDLKTISEDGSMFYRMHQDAKTFVKHIQQKVGGVVTAKPTETFGEVVDKLMSKKVHRVFVVNEHDKPTGLVSMKDIIEDIILRS